MSTAATMPSTMHNAYARIGSPSNPISVLADLIGTGHNAFAGSWTGGAGATAMELAVLDWMRDFAASTALTEEAFRHEGACSELACARIAMSRARVRVA